MSIIDKVFLSLSPSDDEDAVPHLDSDGTHDHSSWHFEPMRANGSLSIQDHAPVYLKAAYLDLYVVNKRDTPASVHQINRSDAFEVICVFLLMRAHSQAWSMVAVYRQNITFSYS